LFKSSRQLLPIINTIMASNSTSKTKIMQLNKKIIIKGTLKLLSGLHIGDSKENVEIGGVDSPVVRRKDNNEPYIPGSSLKGKLRSLLEVTMGEGVTQSGKTSFDFDNYSPKGKIIALLFGSSGNNGTPARILVRDAYLTRDSVKKLEDGGFTDMPFSEVKFENTIDRITGVTVNGGIRQIERVPAGAEFDIEFVINLMEDSKAKESQFLGLLNAGIDLLQHDYLGGSGTRGYGQVAIKLESPTHKTAAEYLKTVD